MGAEHRHVRVWKLYDLCERLSPFSIASDYTSQSWNAAPTPGARVGEVTHTPVDPNSDPKPIRPSRAFSAATCYAHLRAEHRPSCWVEVAR
jgi:hypothetical protein